MDRKQSNWILGELPTLVSEGVLDAASAERMRLRYAPHSGPGRSWTRIVCGVLGALLVGLGVILLLGHNWNSLSRPLRAGISFAPLLAIQSLAAVGWKRRLSGPAWNETVGLLWSLAVGACIALISQTYHLPGDAETFTLTWALLILPVFWFHRAVTVLAVYLGLIVAQAVFCKIDGGVALLFWPLAAVALPVIRKAARPNPYAQRPVFMLWLFALACTAALGITLEKIMPGLWMLLYASLFAVLYLIGGYWGAEAPTFWQRPLHSIGSFGTVVLAYLLTFEWPWRGIGWYHLREAEGAHVWAASFDYFLAFALPLFALGLLVTSVRRGQTRRIPFALLPVLVAAVYSFSCLDSHGATSPAILISNIYLFAIGLSTLVQGVRDRRAGTVNVGMLIIIALILTRFFDSDYSFVAKGIVFIVLGALFLATNLFLSRRLKKGVA